MTGINSANSAKISIFRQSESANLWSESPELLKLPFLEEFSHGQEFIVYIIQLTHNPSSEILWLQFRLPASKGEKCSLTE